MNPKDIAIGLAMAGTLAFFALKKSKAAPVNRVGECWLLDFSTSLPNCQDVIPAFRAESEYLGNSVESIVCRPNGIVSVKMWFKPGNIPPEPGRVNLTDDGSKWFEYLRVERCA